MAMPLKEALYYEPLDPGDVRCRLCPHLCRVPDGKAGLCGARRNQKGRLYAATYGYISACALDPVEKKPLDHFYPGSHILSIGNYGCNLRCAFCQNHGISFSSPEPGARMMTPAQTAELAESLAGGGNIGVAYTYNEPLIAYEYVLDCAAEVRKRGMKNVLVTNGYILQQPLEALLPYIDALNIDLKAFTDAFYREHGGDLETVKQTIASAAGAAHVEITSLIIPGENDDEAEMDALAAFLAGVRKDIPLHVTRFFPRHRMTDKPPTPAETIHKLTAVAKRHLTFVYPGNMR